MKRAVPIAAVAATLAMPGVASAFCGFYVSGADASLYNNATMVVLMREGSTTVLSMQNNYQGPPEDFAMVVPVPVVLEEDNVKTLPREIFTHVDALAAPRLVEYWEQDPCMPQPPMERFATAMPSTAAVAEDEAGAGGDLGVTIEAQFSVAEYDIVILSARDSNGLDTWLRREQYNIPQGAEAVLRPYVAAGTKFFVAKVDARRVTFEQGRAVLSPLRFHYDTQEFSLPVRLGLLNSSGNQDLLVHILARSQRYEVANYQNVTIPTNLRVANAVREDFGTFYDLIFRRAIAVNPRSVVTEYSWDAGSCDPCPEPPLSPEEIMTLGGDVTGGQPYGYVLTRLHYRYGREGLNEDLMFREAPAIVGGRGIPDEQGKLTEQSAAESSVNNFQGRYVILHRWEGAVACDNPVRGRWGGPPGQQQGPTPPVGPVSAGNPALRGGGAPSGSITSIGLVVQDNIPQLQIRAGQAEPALDSDPGPPGGGEPAAGGPPGVVAPAPQSGGCAGCSVEDGSGPASLLLAIALAGWLTTRRRRGGPRS